MSTTSKKDLSDRINKRLGTKIGFEKLTRDDLLILDQKLGFIWENPRVLVGQKFLPNMDGMRDRAGPIIKGAIMEILDGDN